MAETNWQKGGSNPYNLKAFYTNIMKENAMLYKYQFIVQFGGADLQNYGITDSSEAAKNITYYVQSANIPGYQLVNGKTAFLGTEFRIPGVLKYNHNWSVNILLNQSMFAYKGLQAWRRNISRLEIDGGGIKTIPDAYARISLLSPDHQSIVNSFVLAGIWIKQLGEIQLQYQNGGAEPIKCSAEFRYQYCYPDPGVEEVGGSNDPDPLTATRG